MLGGTCRLPPPAAHAPAGFIGGTTAIACVPGRAGNPTAGIDRGGRSSVIVGGTVGGGRGAGPRFRSRQGAVVAATLAFLSALGLHERVQVGCSIRARLQHTKPVVRFPRRGQFVVFLSQESQILQEEFVYVPLIFRQLASPNVEMPRMEGTLQYLETERNAPALTNLRDENRTKRLCTNEQPRF